MKRRRIIGVSTSFPALTAFKKYVRGEMTLEEWRKCKVGEVSTPIYAEESTQGRQPFWPFFTLLAFVLGVTMGVLVSR